MKYTGNFEGSALTVKKGDDVSELETVSGALIIDTEISLPALVEVGGNLIICQKASFPSLVRVGWSLECKKHGIDFPTLKVIGKFPYLHKDVHMPALETIGGLPVLPSSDVLANLKIVAPIALQQGALDMGVVHAKCKTAHCIAGWGCETLPGGRELEKSHDWDVAGAHLLGLEAAKMFYGTDSEARTFLEKFV
ncbi:hypothetical protein LP417_35090 (plasmid) [Polaromonas sp. P1-6]|nr:hypothetical protein LP417_35090 [Polaromonas sp. P1-6]